MIVQTEPIKQVLRKATFFHGHTTTFTHSIADKVDQGWNGHIDPQQLALLLRESLASYRTLEDASHPLAKLGEIHYNQIERDLGSIADQLGFADRTTHGPYHEFAARVKQALAQYESAKAAPWTPDQVLVERSA